MPDLTPGQPAPDLNVDLVGGGSFKLADADPDRFTMVVFYRGLHCPVCRDYNSTLLEHLGEFAERGVEVVAVSMDDQERAQQTVADWQLEGLRVGYGLSEEDARRWGLFISTAASDSEPAVFSEPGLFLVKPDGSLYYAAINSMPWGRPYLPSMLKALDFIIDKDYPVRGVA